MSMYRENRPTRVTDTGGLWLGENINAITAERTAYRVNHRGSLF